MKPLIWVLCALLALSLALTGCGRVGSPGGFSGPAANTRTTPAPTDTPTQSSLQWGPEDAKVHLIGFFFISKDPRYQKHAALFESLAKQYPTQLYVKYWDVRTMEGAQARSQTGTQGSLGLFIDGQSDVELPGKPPRRVSFSQEMGRFWTEEDLRAAVAQAVKKAYGK